MDKACSSTARAGVAGSGVNPRRALALGAALVATSSGFSGCSGARRASRPVSAPSPSPAPATAREPAAETAVETLPLGWPLDDPTAELSDLAWAGDELLLLPQFPSSFGPQLDGTVFKLRRDDIERWLNGDRGRPLDVRRVAFEAPGVAERIEGFQGFEALAIEGDHVYLTAESRREGRMHAHLLQGELDADRGRLTVRADSLVELPCPGNLSNIAYEAMTVFRGSVVTFYESNGHSLVREPAALFWDRALSSFERLPMSPLEFRVTGASAVDAAGRFWVTNVFWPGEKALRADDDPLFAAYGRGATHARSSTVERLVELRLGPSGVERTATPPLQLALADGELTRNWEGIARLDDRGFLLVADEHPTTILAFVPNALVAAGAR